MYDETYHKENLHISRIRNNVERVAEIATQGSSPRFGGTYLGSESSSEISPGIALSIQETRTPAMLGGLAAPLNGPILSAHAPRGGMAQGGTISEDNPSSSPDLIGTFEGFVRREEVPVSGSWDPSVFRPDGCGYPALADRNNSGVKLPVSAPKPGHGFKTPQCGVWLFTGKDENGNIKIVNHSCKTIGCPEDWTDYISEKAGDIEEKFRGYNEALTAYTAGLCKDFQGPRYQNPRQFIFSMTPGRVAELWHIAGKNHEAFLDTFRVAFKDALDVSGLAGGVIIYHDSRVRHPGTGATGARGKLLIIREAKLAGAMTDDSPASALYEYIAGQPNHEEYYYFSPHFHVIAFGRSLDTDIFKEQMPDWILKNRGDVKAVAGLAYYLMSHVAVLPSKKSVSWFGCMSSKNLRKEKAGERIEDIFSPDGLPYFIVDAENKELIGQKMTRTITLWTWWISKAVGPEDYWKVCRASYDRSLKKRVRDLDERARALPAGSGSSKMPSWKVNNCGSCPYFPCVHGCE